MHSTPVANLTYLASPKTIFHGCHIIYWGPRNANIFLSLKINSVAQLKYGTVSMATVNVILEDRECTNKIDLISTVTYSKLLKMVSF